MAKDINLEGTGKHNGHAFVDLGLPSGLKWATCNVGASKPEDHGDYFAWGETEPKKSYSKENYELSLGIMLPYKYFPDDDYWFKEHVFEGVDNLQTLEAEDDAATAKWGDGWRMPTGDELQELVDKCKWEAIKQNGVEGFKVIGPNGNSIFMLEEAYWSSSLLNPTDADYLSVDKSWGVEMTPDGDCAERQNGHVVRPVCTK